MEYKAVFIDIDGTLLTDNQDISPGTKQVIRALHRSGVLIVLVTARAPGASLPFYSQLGIEGNPLICFNGALIIRDGVYFHDVYMEGDEFRSFLKETDKFDVSTSYYRHDDWFTTQLDVWIRDEMEITKIPITHITIKQLLSEGFSANKILCMGPTDEMLRLVRHLRRRRFDLLTFFHSKANSLEVLCHTTSKSFGINKIISALGISPKEIIAIGDHFNDIDMLRFAGTSVVMDNAHEKVRQYADMVTDDNNSEGVKNALEKLFPGI